MNIVRLNDEDNDEYEKRSNEILYFLEITINNQQHRVGRPCEMWLRT